MGFNRGKMKMLIRVLVFLFVYTGAHDTPFDILYEACPYTDFCLSNARKIFRHDTSTSMPCCPLCSCDDNCTITQDCCPDKDINHHDHDPLFLDSNFRFDNSSMSCKASMVKTVKPDELFDGYTLGIKRYKVIDRCPDTEDNRTIILKCAGDQRTSIMEYVWVSDKTDGMIYQNRFCAQCNGVAHMTDWTIRALCSSNIANTANLRLDIIQTDYCELINEVPMEELKRVARHRCYKPVVQSCNQTGLMVSHDEHYRTACGTLMFPFVQPGVKYVYQNVFCYICNGNDIAGVDDVCPQTDDGNKGDRPRFNALLNWRHDEAQVNRLDMQCEDDEVFDKYKVSPKIACWVNFHAIFTSAYFFKSIFFSKDYFRKHYTCNLRVSNGLDPDQD